MELPHKVLGDIIQAASSRAFKEYAVQFLTSIMFVPAGTTTARIRLPFGEVIEKAAKEYKVLPVPEYWHTWREYDNYNQALEEAHEFLKTQLHNYNVGHKWEPIRIVRFINHEIKVLKLWNTPEDASREIGLTPEQATEEVEREIRKRHHLE